MEIVKKKHLPRLSREWYRGRAFVHWTLTTEQREAGWLTAHFHQGWQLMLLHTCARYELVCPAYVLMPDHIHLICLGLNERGSDQSVAIEFLRKETEPQIDPAKWQRQPYDHVLREDEQRPDSFLTVAGYILDNPIRAGLVPRREDWPYKGCCVPGYPRLDVMRMDYWELFWRIYNRLIERT